MNNNKKKFLIVGGEFNNKGAQAMTFVAIHEIKKRFPNCSIQMLSSIAIKKEEVSLYQIKLLEESIESKYYAHGKKYMAYALLRYFIKKIIIKKVPSIKNSKRAYKNADAIIDISGYALSSQWGMKRSDLYLRRIEIAEKYNIAYYIFPQSIGPFDYKNGKFIDKIKKILSYPKIIYVREKEGYKLLKSLELENIKLSSDLVLQNKELDLSVIYKKIPKFKTMKIERNSVGILPNMHNFNYGNKNQIMSLYKEVIECLLSKDRTVYLLKHSGEDSEACKMIEN